MSYAVTVTFDIHNSENADYDEINEALVSIGLYKNIKANNNKTISLPNNTYFGEFNNYQTNSAGDLRENIANRIKKEFDKMKLKSNIFVAVGGDWAWGSSKT